MEKVRVSTIVPFGLRLQPDLKSRLEEAAALSNRSLNAEIAARLERSLSDPQVQEADRQIEVNAILTSMGNTIAEIAKKDNEREDGVRAMGRDLHALCARALPFIEDEGRYRSLVRMLADVGVSMQAGDITDAQARMRALFYLAADARDKNET